MLSNKIQEKRQGGAKPISHSVMQTLDQNVDPGIERYQGGKYQAGRLSKIDQTTGSRMLNHSPSN